MTSWIDPSLALPLPRQDGSPRVIHFNRPTFLLTNRDPPRPAPRGTLAHPPTRLLEPWAVGHFRWVTFGGSLARTADGGAVKVRRRCYGLPATQTGSGGLDGLWDTLPVPSIGMQGAQRKLLGDF